MLCRAVFSVVDCGLCVCVVCVLHVVLCISMAMSPGMSHQRLRRISKCLRENQQINLFSCQPLIGGWGGGGLDYLSDLSDKSNI